MTIEERKKHFIDLGKFLGQFHLDSTETIKNGPENQRFFERNEP